jgi:hypothetical protein
MDSVVTSNNRTPEKAISIVSPKHFESLSMALNDQINMTFDSIDEEMHNNDVLLFEDGGFKETQSSNAQRLETNPEDLPS